MDSPPKPLVTPVPMETDQTSSKSTKFRKENRLSLRPTGDFIEIKSAFGGALKTYYYRNINVSFKDICLILVSIKEKIKNLIKNYLNMFGPLKFNLMVECTYYKMLTEEQQARAFKTLNYTVLSSTSLDSILRKLFQKICIEESEQQSKGSGWSLYKVDGVMVRFSRFKPLGGKSYIPLPRSVQLKMAIINPKNIADTECFKWALLSRYVKGRMVCRIDNRYRDLEDRFDFTCINFPVALKDISKFEKHNPTVSVNVYGLNDKNDVYPLRICKRVKDEHFDLLLITNAEGNSHYCYIKNFSRLLSSQISKTKRATVFCRRCLTHFHKKSNLTFHEQNCSVNKAVKVKMAENKNNPVVPKILKFADYHHKYRLPIVAYGDFECILNKVDIKKTTYTTIEQQHEPCSFCVYLVIDDDLPDFIKNKLPKQPYLFRGENASSVFMDYIINLANLIGELFDKNVPMLPLTDEDKVKISNCKFCELCNVEFSAMCLPIRDHCHLSGKFRSVLCNNCNLKRQDQKFLPIFLHGSSNYDSHFLVKQLGCDKERVIVIPNSNEKYISFIKNTKSNIKIKFLDSYRFLGESLDTLVKNLPDDMFKHLDRFFVEDERPLVRQKGVYPYSYTDSWAKLDETKLPDKESFYNEMTESHVSEKDYERAQLVWNKFKCTTLGDYSDLYLRTDVLLLCDVFENFRNICLTNYELDPVYYMTVPSLTFSAMLKYTKVELELFNDYEKYLFIENNIRGGITMCVKRHAVANNPYMGTHYNPSADTSYLTYLDCNNMYGFSMCEPMPEKEFKWLSHKRVQNFDVLSIPDDGPYGYIIECDVGYPSYLHDSHADLPFLSVKKCPEWSKQEKLLNTLENKYNYVCHFRTLKQALQNGLVLIKVHRVLKFCQRAWLKPYIDLNTEKRKAAKNEFEKNFYKLLNNAMFGKTIENVRKRVNIELVTNEKRLNKLITKPNFKNRIIYGDNLCAVELEKDTIVLDKPIYVGFTVLELSKHHMYDFHYRIMKNMFKNKMFKLLYVDTDSFFYQIFTDDLYSDFNRPEFKKHLDMSDYPPDHVCYSIENKKKLGLFKDEANGVVIIEFIGLRPKLYTFKTLNDFYLEVNKNMSLKKAKGITKTVVKNHITFDDYKRCLYDKSKIRRNIRLFQSKKHCVQTVTVNKIALSCNDDKRVICENNIETLPYGHIRLKNRKFVVKDGIIKYL
ncbi:uncharacterized protein LOC128985776 isoform X1 [Macrosteles quadrilineatus]|uniref:uncharacterized protein LOC128985774 isoform X1 n=1 Tax=Macrosteles quadrilineatus TaxID=74068 RepID=UPI0023E0A0C8|nr:uncharacterized protein LOC128985774 isoform X1 [Macrosteles quadrilineatus]XP_054261609.1 uncharacterized protein LOC128985774 isoform X1 [Macrosteles quadrilineatus]XP_054261610.1 uncharacterized protein LOC128985774 isoform X1 [Macrosteles quadrilineatus]XP_054261611.1 uncharacterized protein LOC128985774 isoform X1 [Macrosteles quadrilineatus]XP_054261615.1 uncharacterized protein LOC128985776 isoform X1 [Macrosteles quadrilineatus]XP_054261616.1 uncharacterized protein LOC128985776 iso